MWSFPRCAYASATLGAYSARRPGCNAGALESYGRPQRAGPARSPLDQDARAHHRQVAPAPATSAKYTMPRIHGVAKNDRRLGVPEDDGRTVEIPRKSNLTNPGRPSVAF